MRELFHKFALRVSQIIGSPYTFILAVLLLIGWFVSGYYFKFSDEWQLVINTGTTIVTFLIVFLIQNTENRESKAINLKLDEIIRVIRQARNEIIEAENFPEDKLEEMEKEFINLAEKEKIKITKKSI